MKETKKKLIVIGAGDRGMGYTNKIKTGLADLFEVVAVAEPVDDRREYMQKTHNIPAELCFADWKPLLERPRLADAAIIATMDRDHFAPAMAAIRLGYDLLLEKPAGATPEQCLRIAEEAKKYGVRVLVCHVLRYTPFFRAIKLFLESGELGEIVSIQHREDVGDVHQTHSFVRGNWGNSERSSPMILQKSCHDMDILQWLIGKKCLQVQSFGSLTYFTPAHAPEGSTERCFDCPHADSCSYSAKKLYLESRSAWFRCAATKRITPTDDDVRRALDETQYGKCVFHCDNDVVDHQVVNLLFEGGITVTFSMCAFTRGGRALRIMGTRGELSATFEEGKLNFFDFRTRQTRTMAVEELVDTSIVGGHGGGDEGICMPFTICSTGEKISRFVILKNRSIII